MTAGLLSVRESPPHSGNERYSRDFDLRLNPAVAGIRGARAGASGDLVRDERGMERCLNSKPTGCSSTFHFSTNAAAPAIAASNRASSMFCSEAASGARSQGTAITPGSFHEHAPAFRGVHGSAAISVGGEM